MVDGYTSRQAENRKDDSEKRKIRVCYLKPKELEGDAIYYVIGRDDRGAYADIFSQNEFAGPRNKRFLGFDMHLIDFDVEELERSNNAVSEDKRIEDGLELVVQLNKLRVKLNRFVTSLNTL